MILSAPTHYGSHCICENCKVLRGFTDPSAPISTTGGCWEFMNDDQHVWMNDDDACWIGEP